MRQRAVLDALAQLVDVVQGVRPVRLLHVVALEVIQVFINRVVVVVHLSVILFDQVDFLLLSQL